MGNCLSCCSNQENGDFNEPIDHYTIDSTNPRNTEPAGNFHSRSRLSAEMKRSYSPDPESKRVASTRAARSSLNKDSKPKSDQTVTVVPRKQPKKDPPREKTANKKSNNHDLITFSESNVSEQNVSASDQEANSNPFLTNLNQTNVLKRLSSYDNVESSSFDSDTHKVQRTNKEADNLNKIREIGEKAEGIRENIKNLVELESSNSYYFIEESLRRFTQKLDEMYDDIEDSEFLEQERKNVYKVLFQLFHELDEKLAENKSRIKSESNSKLIK